MHPIDPFMRVSSPGNCPVCGWQAVKHPHRKDTQGGDVQTYLPKLALFMGHVSIVSTAHYLHFIPQVAALASKRFDRHFSRLIEPGAS
jgi:hypothetical protein